MATKGSDLSKTSAFLAFYALPYVPDPGSHPTFQDLFTEVRPYFDSPRTNNY